MGTLRRWVGPSKAEIWKQLAADVGGQFVAGGAFKADKVQASHGEWTVTLDTYTVSTGKSVIIFTRLRAPYVNPGGFRFTVYRKGMFSELGKLLGMQDVIVGHDPFDEDFVVQGTDEAKLRELFSSEPLRTLLSRQPDVKFSVKDDEGWFGPSFPEGVDELHFVVGGIVKDLDRRKGLFDLFAETLDQLCRVGAAYESAPDVRL